MIRSSGHWMGQRMGHGMGPRMAAGALVAMLVIAVAGCDATTPTTPEASRSDSVGHVDGDLVGEVLADPDPYARARRLGTLLPNLGPEAIPEVREALEDAMLRLGAADFDLLLHFWASHEPEAASHWAVYEALPVYKNLSIATTMELLARANPATALRAVQRTQAEADEEAARAAEMALVRGWFQVDRPALEKYIQDLGIGKIRQRAVLAYSLALLQAEGSDAVMRWAESVQEDESRYKLDVYRQVASAFTWADMDAAVRWCNEQCDGPWGNRMRTMILRARLRNGEPGGELIEWATQASAETEEQIEDKRHTLWLTFAMWANQDRAAALEWMQQKVSGEHEDWVKHLYEEYAKQLAKESPAEGIRWAERVEDEQRRRLVLMQVGALWCEQDVAACESWLDGSPLSENERARVRHPKTGQRKTGQRG